MDAIVVYESIYGNTHAVAEAVAEGLGGVPVLSVHEAAGRAHERELDLLVVGGPTHIHGLATYRSRHAGAETRSAEGGGHMEPDATEPPGLRSWLQDLSPAHAHHAAAFDTRLDRSPWLTGTAARGIARRLRRRGIDVVDTESFLVEDAEGPLQAGELDRARAWGIRLAESLRPLTETPVETSS